MSEQKKQIYTKSFSFELLWRFLRGRFDLGDDQAAEEEVKENITRGVEFKGTNLWVLIFATFVASLGLNINSTAVIIGAMLISPLMGPIMGIGLSVGINDFELMKRSFRNVGLMVLVSILASMLYFLLSPLNQAQSELLARTTPTIYDVLIAFFGGLAGIVAQSRKDRTSTVIPGVAIATALMPPLCTAGYALATWQMAYFVGAFYLFFINAVFIAIATFIVVRFMGFSKKVFLDPTREHKVRRNILVIVILTMIPSVILAFRMIRQNLFEVAADRYVVEVIRFPQAKVLDVEWAIRPDGSRYIDVLLFGEPVSADAIENARLQMANYKLDGTELIVRQSSGNSDETVDISTLQSGYRELLSEKNRRIGELESRLNYIASDSLPEQDIAREMMALAPEIERVALSRVLGYNAEGHHTDTTVVCLVALQDGKPIPPAERKRIEEWLRTRTKNEKIYLYVE